MEVLKREDETNIEYGLTTVDLEGNLDQEFIDVVTNYCERHKNSDVLMILVDLNTVLRESNSGRTWIIASSDGFRQLYDNRARTLSPRAEKLQLKIYLPKKSAEVG